MGKEREREHVRACVRSRGRRGNVRNMEGDEAESEEGACEEKDNEMEEEKFERTRQGWKDEKCLSPPTFARKSFFVCSILSRFSSVNL